MHSIQVHKLGNFGQAYDSPSTKRAYSYENPPGNVVASRIGSAAQASRKLPAGGEIDLGLNLLRELHRFGLGVFELSESSLKPVHGDCLPAIGSKVYIHLASIDKWVEHSVCGYYAYPALDDSRNHRVFIRVLDAAGYENARLLEDVRFKAEANPALIDEWISSILDGYKKPLETPIPRQNISILTTFELCPFGLRRACVLPKLGEVVDGIAENSGAPIKLTVVDILFWPPSMEPIDEQDTFVKLQCPAGDLHLFLLVENEGRLVPYV